MRLLTALSRFCILLRTNQCRAFLLSCSFVFFRIFKEFKGTIPIYNHLLKVFFFLVGKSTELVISIVKRILIGRIRQSLLGLLSGLCLWFLVFADLFTDELKMNILPSLLKNLWFLFPCSLVSFCQACPFWLGNTVLTLILATTVIDNCTIDWALIIFDWKRSEPFTRSVYPT